MNAAANGTLRRGTLERLEAWLATWSGRRSPVWMGLVCLLFAVQIRAGWEPGQDASGYLSIARNLSRGTLGCLGSPILQYSPGYPLTIAPCFWFSDRPFLGISVLHFAMAVGLLLGLWRWFRHLAPASAALLTLLVMVNVGVWQAYRQTLSEFAFLLVLVWSTYLLDAGARSLDTKTGFGRGLRGAMLVAFLGLIRQVGVFLGGGYALRMLRLAFRGRTSYVRALGGAVLISVPAVILVFALVWRDEVLRTRAHLSADRSNIQQLVHLKTTLAWRVAEGLRLRTGECGRLMIPGMFKAYSRAGQWLHPNTILYGLFTAALFLGWWRVARRRLDTLLHTFPLYFAFHVFWPYDQGARFFVPMVPVLAVSLWGLLQPLRRGRLTVLFACVILHAFVSVGYWSRSARKEAGLHRQWPAVETLARCIAAEGPRGAAFGLPSGIRSMLQFQADRYLPEVDGAASLPPDVEWAVTTTRGSAPAGFTERCAAGDVRLLKKSGGPN